MPHRLSRFRSRRSPVNRPSCYRDRSGTTDELRPYDSAFPNCPQLKENPPDRAPLLCNIRSSLAPRNRNTGKALWPLPVHLRGLRRHGTLCVCKVLSSTAPTSASNLGIALTGGHTARQIPCRLRYPVMFVLSHEAGTLALNYLFPRRNPPLSSFSKQHPLFSCPELLRCLKAQLPDAPHSQHINPLFPSYERSYIF